MHQRADRRRFQFRLSVCEEWVHAEFAAGEIPGFVHLDAGEEACATDVCLHLSEDDYPQTTQKFVAWHQDLTYWGLEPPDALTAWYAVDNSDVENGCMRVIPGSHRGGIVEHGKSTRPGNLLSINQAVHADVDESQAVDLELKAGQISIHHGHLIHGSNPNTSDRRRCGLTLRYCPPSVKPVRENSIGRPWPAVLVRGEDRFKNFGDRELLFA